VRERGSVAGVAMGNGAGRRLQSELLREGQVREQNKQRQREEEEQYGLCSMSVFVTGDLGKALKIYTEIYKTNPTYSIIDLSPDNLFYESGLLEIVRNGQTHVLATDSPGKGRI
jgi:hypothetical protein